MSARRPGLAACVMYTEWYQGIAYRPAVRRNVEPEYRHPIQAQGRLMWSMLIRSQGAEERAGSSGILPKPG
jgi:hypothetical protein